jgi:hypothetical protein
MMLLDDFSLKTEYYLRIHCGRIHPSRLDRRGRLTLALGALCAFALTGAACSGSGGGSGGKTIDAGGTTIPARTTTTSTQPTITTADGAPKVVQFASPRQFWCMKAHPGQAQVTVGWSVPSATTVTVALDGTSLHSGIRKVLPFWVPAGKADGIGATVVFPCSSGNSHRITVRWRMRRSPTEMRTVTIRKAAPGA